jgi:hypothetical protein
LKLACEILKFLQKNVFRNGRNSLATDTEDRGFVLAGVQRWAGEWAQKRFSTSFNTGNVSNTVETPHSRKKAGN